MKAEKLLMSISLLVVLLLFSGCGKELEDLSSLETGSDVESPEGSGQAEGEILRLQVSDAGFIDANTGSRAIDEGLTTKFEDGDQIGLFVVNSQNKILYANVPYTKEGDVWTTKENIRTKSYPVRVFAYYPYVPDDEIIAKVDSTADNYSDFFKTYIDELDISNQSSLADYRKADVMACMVEVGGKEEAREALTLTMNHLMGLVVVNLPETVILSSVDYCLKGDESYMWTVKDVTLPANLSDELFEITGGIQPLKEETGWRYLCRPGDDGISNISFSGSFITYGETKDYEVNNGIVSAGSNQIYNLSVKPFVFTGKIEYTPQVGDFYMNDGAILPSISEDNKGNCIGIVYWVPTSTEPLDSHKATWLEEHSTCTNGLVVGLKEQSSQWGTKGEITNITDSNTDGIFRGYSNTKRLVSEYSSYAIVSAYYNLMDTMTLPSGKTSGWYVPSVGELKELFNSMIVVQSSLNELENSLAPVYYRTSGEHPDATTFAPSHAWCVQLANGIVGNLAKEENERVRLVFAF